MTTFVKWIEDVRGDQPVTEVGRYSLEQRLAAVRHFLPLAATQAGEDIEYVHQLRVGTRRALAAVRLYEDLLRPRDARWCKKQLRKLRRAAGDARDLDVLAERLQADRRPGANAVRKELRQRRQAAQEPLAVAYRKLSRQERFDRRMKKLLRAVEKSPEDALFAAWARRRLAAMWEPFCEAADAAARSDDALHKFRIRGKALRYAMELLVAAFPDAFRTELYPQLEALQEGLGQINDRRVAMERLRTWSQTPRSKKQTHYVERLIAEQQHELEQLIAAHRQWWTPRTAEQFAAGIERMVDRAPAEKE